MKKTIVNLFKALTIPAATYLIFLIASFQRFGTIGVFYAVLTQSVVPAILGFSVAYSFLSGIMDFTVGSRLILGSLIGSIGARYFGIAGLIVGCIAASVILGAITALLNNLLRIPSLILTLGLALLYEVLGYWLKIDSNITFLAREHTVLGKSHITLLIFVFTAVLFYFLFYRLKVTYHIRAVGTNPVLARNLGINTNRSKLAGFVIGSVFLGIASLLQVSYAGTTTTQIGLTSAVVLFKPLMGVLIGMVIIAWCNMAVGIFIGTLAVNIIFIGLLAAGLPDTLQDVALGIFILLVMFISGKRGEIVKLFRKSSRKKSPVEETGN